MQEITFENKDQKSDIYEFVETLPRRMTLELRVVIHNRTVARIPFF